MKSSSAPNAWNGMRARPPADGATKRKLVEVILNTVTIPAVNFERGKLGGRGTTDHVLFQRVSSMMYCAERDVSGHNFEDQ